MYCISSHRNCNCRYDPAPHCQGNSIIKQLYCFKKSSLALPLSKYLAIAIISISVSLPLSLFFTSSECSHRDCFQSARRNCLICLFWIATSQSIFNRGWGWDESNPAPTTPQSPPSSAILPSLSSSPSLFLLAAISKNYHLLIISAVEQTLSVTKMKNLVLVQLLLTFLCDLI